jgi:hypothetical protein
MHEREEHMKLYATMASCKSFRVREGKYFRTVWTEDKGHVHTFLQRCHSQRKHLTRVFGNIASYHGHFNLRKQINIIPDLRNQSLDPILHSLLSVRLYTYENDAVQTYLCPSGKRMQAEKYLTSAFDVRE